MDLSESQKKIIIAAKTIFVKKGYEGTSMNAIAEFVGIRKATLYSHFNHKEALFRIVFETIIEDHTKSLLKLFRGIECKPIKSQLYELLHNYIQYCYHNNNIEMWDRFYYFPPEPMRSWIRRMTHKSENQFRDKITSIITLGQEQKIIKDYNPEYILQLYYHMMLGFVLSAPEYENNDMEESIKHCFELFWDGVKL